MHIIVIVIISADLRKKLDPLIILAIALGSALGLFVLSLVVVVAIVLFYNYKGRGQKLASIEGMLDELVKQKPHLPPEEVKRHLNNLHKAHLKLMFPNMRIEFDAANNLNKKPVIMFTQFLEDSFIEGFKSDDWEEFDTSFMKITRHKERVDNSNNDTDDRGTKDQASGTNEMPNKTADESKDAPTLSCMTSQV